MTADVRTDLLPAKTSAHVLRWFRWYIRRMCRKSFSAVRLSNDSASALEALRDNERPLIVAMNHQSWWDPLIGLLVASALCPDRPGLAPMDREMLERFAILRRVGVFGIDPDDPTSLDAMRQYVGNHFEAHSNATLWLTPQGEFADPRALIRLRPGASALAADRADVRVVSLAIEYPFWLDKRPEVLLHMSEVEPPNTPSTASWHRAITRAMQRDNKHLAALTTARNPDAFTPLIDARTEGPSPVYALWLRLRGKQADLASERTARPNTPPTSREYGGRTP